MRPVLITAIILAGLPLVPLRAQSASGNSDEAAQDAGNLIIVVGQKAGPITVQPLGLSISLGKNEFEGVNAVNVEDLMKYAPNFYVRKRFAGDDNAVVALRGANTVQSARTIVMVDGFVVSNFLGNRWDYPPKWNVVGPSEVRQFDIVYGPYSARYGGNSMGGVISISTQQPKDTSGYAIAQAVAMPYHEYGVDRTFTGHSLEAGVNWRQDNGPWSLRVSGRHFRNTGQPMTYGLLVPAIGETTTRSVTGAHEDPQLSSPVYGAASPVDVTQDQLRLRLGYEFPHGWQINLLGMAWFSLQDLTRPRSWLADARTGEPVYQGKVSYDGRVWNAAGLTRAWTQRAEYLLGLKSEGSWDDWDVSLNLSRYWIANQDSRTSKDFVSGIGSGAGTQSLAGEPGWYTGDLTIERHVGAHRLAVGANANLYETRSDTFTTTSWINAVQPTFNSATFGKTGAWGLWLEDSLQLGSNWHLTGGLRYDRWQAFGGGVAKAYGGLRKEELYPTRTDASISPKLSLQGKVAPDVDVQLSLGTAKRFPTVGELFQGRFDDVTQALDPQSFDPSLKAETSRDANLILHYTAGGVRLTASAFYQTIRNAIYSFSGLNQFGTLISSFKNVDLVRQYGAELIIEAENILPGLDLDANASWLSARTVKNSANPAAEGARFPRIPEWRSNGSLRYRLADPLKLSLGWRFSSRPNSDLFGRQRGDAYGYQSELLIVDTRLSCDVGARRQISLGIDNVLNDRAYVSHPLPQRSFIIEGRAQW